MSTAKGCVHLVGTIPLADTREVFQTVPATLGARLAGFGNPDPAPCSERRPSG